MLAQVRAGIQRLAGEVSEHKDDTITLREDVSKVWCEFGKDLDTLKDDVIDARSDSANAQKLAEEMRDLVLQLKGRQESITSNAVEMAQDAVSEAVEVLGQRLEQDLAEPLARCDAGAADCERIVQEALSKVGAMEGQLLAIATDLRAQLAQEGGTLLEVLSAPSIRYDSGVEPTAAVAVAAREMLSGMSPARSLPAPDAADLAPQGRLGNRETALGTPPPSVPPRLPALGSASVAYGSSACEPSGTAIAAHSGGADSLDEITQRLHEQEQLVEELRQWKMSLQGEVEGFLVEHRVSRSLAGLERRSRSPQAVRNASTQEVHCGRRSYSMDSIRITGWN